MQTKTSIMAAVATFIGGLSGLQSTVLVVSMIVTVLVGWSAFSKNRAETELANRKLNMLPGSNRDLKVEDL